MRMNSVYHDLGMDSEITEITDPIFPELTFNDLVPITLYKLLSEPKNS